MKTKFDMMDLLRTLENLHYEVRSDGVAGGCILEMIETIREYYNLEFCEQCSKLYEKHDLILDGFNGKFCDQCAPALHREAEREELEAELTDAWLEKVEASRE